RSRSSERKRSSHKAARFPVPTPISITKISGGSWLWFSRSFNKVQKSATASATASGLFASDFPLGNAWSYPLPEAASQSGRCCQKRSLNFQIRDERIGVNDSIYTRFCPSRELSGERSSALTNSFFSVSSSSCRRSTPTSTHGSNSSPLVARLSVTASRKFALYCTQSRCTFKF